ncbi:Serine/threonine-protein phosphatase 7 long form [Glycine max]|nr:Serine/threonine-protein phosphatase 7 long form [Glycine max]
MTSSSSCPSHIKIKSGPIDGDVLWMQPKHVSEHVWNVEEDRKLHIRLVVPTYQGEEEISEQIFPFLRQSGFYWIMKMGYLKINVSFFDRKMEAENTYVSHEMRRVYYYSSRRLRVDSLPLIDPTNLNWTDLCEGLLGVRLQEGEIKGSVVKLSWLAHHFAQINNHDDKEQVRRFARAWILRFIGGVLFVDKSINKVSLRQMCSATDYKTKSIGGMCILLQMWACERCPTLAPKRTPSQVVNKPLGHRWLRRGNQHIGNDDVRVFRRKLDIMKRHEPYTTTVISLLPPICVVESVAWCTVVPLICFQVIE